MPQTSDQQTATYSPKKLRTGRIVFLLASLATLVLNSFEIASFLNPDLGQRFGTLILAIFMLTPYTSLFSVVVLIVLIRLIRNTFRRGIFVSPLVDRVQIVVYSFVVISSLVMLYTMAKVGIGLSYHP